MKIKRIIAAILVTAFIFTQSVPAYAYDKMRAKSAGETPGVARAVGRDILATAQATGLVAPVNVDVFSRLRAAMLPEYDHKKIKEAVEGAIDPATGHVKAEEHERVLALIHRELARSNNRGNAAENARTIAMNCLENDISFGGYRAGRATYQDAMLWANAEAVEAGKLRQVISRFAKVQQKRFGFGSNSALKSHDADMSFLAAEVLTFISLLQQDEISESQIIGAREDLIVAADNILARIRKTRDEADKALAPKKAARVAALSEKAKRQGRKLSRQALIKEAALVEEKRLAADMQKAEALISQAKQLATDVLVTFHASPRRYRNYVVELARPSQTGAWATFWTNEGIDPHFSADREIPEVAQKALPRCHGTPDWEEYLEWMTDIVESAPAYAAHKFSGEAPGEIDVYVEREAIRELYRVYGVSMARNIEHTLASECTLLAREFLFRHVLGRKAKSDEEILAKTRELVQRGAITESDIAEVAAVIWHDYFATLRTASMEEAGKVGYEADRVQILRGLLYREDTPAEGFAQLRKSGGDIRSMRTQARDLLKSGGAAYIMPDMELFALAKRRPLPAIHVSTTLGPTETRRIIFILEEAMQLYLVSRSQGLEPEVARRVKAYKDRYKMVRARLEKELTCAPRSYTMEAEANRLFMLLNILKPISDPGQNPDDEEDLERLDKQIEQELQAMLGGAYAEFREGIAALARDMIERETKGASPQLGIDKEALIQADIRSRMREEFCSRKRLFVDEDTKGRVGNVADYYVRREILAAREYSQAMNDARFRFTAGGYMPDVYVGYTPSRFDMGREQIYSVRNVAKMFAAEHPKAYERFRRFYADYNYRPWGFRSFVEAEFAKTGENFFSRSVPSSASIGGADFLRGFGTGIYEQFRQLWNSRGDRLVLPATAGYPGYCIPKEYILLLAAIVLRNDPEGFDNLLDEIGILRDPKVRGQFKQDCQTFLDGLPACPSREDIQKAAEEIFQGKYQEYTGMLEDVTPENFAQAVEAYQKGRQVALYGFIDGLLLLYETGILGQSWQGPAKDLEDRFTLNTAQAFLKIEEVNRMNQFRTLLNIYKACRLKWEIDPEMRARYGCPETDGQGRPVTAGHPVYEEKFQDWFKSRRLAINLTYKPEADDTRNANAARLLSVLSGLTTLHYYEVDTNWQEYILDLWKEVFGDFISPTFASVRVVSPAGFTGYQAYMPAPYMVESLKAATHKAADVLTQAGLSTDWIQTQELEHGVNFHDWDWKGAGKTEDEAANIFEQPEVQMGLVPLAFGFTPEDIVRNIEGFIIRRGIYTISTGEQVSIWGDNPRAALAANVASYEGDIRSWPQIKDLLKSGDPKEQAQAEAIVKGVGPAIHIYATFGKTFYEIEQDDALTGVDIVDLGIPGPHLLELCRDMPGLLQRMDQRHDSSHIFVSGSSAARLTAWDYMGVEEDVAKLLFAYDPKAVYVSMTTGLEGTTRSGSVERWRQEALQERAMAEKVYNTVMAGDRAAAQSAFDAMAGYIKLWGLAEYTRRHLTIVRQNGLPSDIYDYYAIRAEVFQAIENGDISLADGNFGFDEFALTMGRLFLEGRFSEDELQQGRRRFNEHVGNFAAAAATGNPDLYGTAAVSTAADRKGVTLSSFGRRPAHRASPFKLLKRIGVATSLKDVKSAATTEKGGYVSGLEEASRQSQIKERTAVMLKTVRDKCGINLQETEALPAVTMDIGVAYKGATDEVGLPSDLSVDYRISHMQYGIFLGFLNTAYMRLINDVLGDSQAESELKKQAFEVLRKNLNGGVFDRAGYVSVVKMLGKIATASSDDDEKLKKILKVAEMVDIAYLTELLLGHDAFDASSATRTESRVWAALGEFFDAAVSTRTYDYDLLVMDKETTPAFQRFTRDQAIGISKRYVQGWLFPFISWMVRTHTEYAPGVDYADSWLGEWHKEGDEIVADKKGIGVAGETDDEKLWFSYTRLFDAAQLAIQGQAAPIVIRGADPAVMGFEGEGVSNRAIWYPISQHTVRTTLEACPAMAEHGINLFACADLRVQDTPDGRKIILADSAYFKADKEKMRRLLEAAGYDAGQIERIVENINDPLGVPVVIEFTRPVRCHSVWFHAFNTKLPEAEDVDAHVIQPRLSETLCYGKAFYGDIYEGKAPAPPQREIFMDRDTVGSTYGGWDKMPAELKEYLEQHPELCPAAVSEEERKQEIREAILSLCKETGEKSVRLISPVSFNKPEYESGGRGQEYFIYDEGGGIIESNVEKAVQHGLDVLKVDDLVLQAGLPSYFDRLYSESAMERFVDLMATERSMGVPAYAPVYNYARDIVVLLTASKERIPHQDFKDRFGILPNPEGVIEVEGPEGIYYYYAVSHPMDIISIQPVGNAARHGRVLRHTPENIKERYRADHEFARRQSIAASLRAELVYMRENWKRMLADRMKHDPELGRNPRMLQYLSMEALDLPPSFFIIPYQMGDYKEEWLVDEHDRVVVVYDYTTSQFISVNDLEAFYDADGKTVPVNDQARQLFNDDGSQRVLYFRNPIQAREQGLDPESFRLRSMVMSKIEPNPGLGLWTPYAAEEAMAGGRGTAAFTVMFSFGQWWDMFRDWPGETTPAAIGPAPAAVPLVLVTQKYLETAEQRAVKMAAIQLGKEGPANEAVFKVEEVSVVLAFWMYLSGKTAIEVGDAHILKGAIRCEDAELLDKLLVSPDKQDYRDFIAEQIVPEMKWVSQQVGSEDFVPPAIMIAPDVLSEDEADSIFGTDRTNVAVVFNASYTTSQHGVEQLQRDANKALGLKKVNVLGVPKVSLRDDYKTNVAIASPQGRPVIYMLEKGLPINRIRPDNLGGLEGVSELQEHQELAEWAKEAGIPITCDAEHAALVSDKAATYKALEDIGFKAVSIPPYRLVSGETEARPAVESFGNSIVYIQPNNEGTEGRGAEAFNTADSAELENAVHHATEIVSSGNRALIRQSVGNLYYSDAETPEGVETDHRLVTLRINAGSNVQTSFARTGFAMVAKDTHASVTSTERGGTIEDINITLHKKLWYRDAAGQWQRFIPKSQEIRRIYSSAATTAEKFKQGLCGIDVVLEVNPEGRLLNTYLLDINARGVLRPANRILAQMPSDYKPEDHVMIAPREFWQQVAGASAAGDMVTKVLPQTMLDALYRWREVHQVKNQLRVLCGSKHEADIQDYADRCIRTIKEALTRGFASEDQPIILLSVPGRVKPIGNACDYAGALFDSAAMATIEDNIFVISPRNDGKIHLGTLYPDKYPDKDCRVTDAGLNPNHIIKDRYTWDEWFASVAEEDRPMPEGVIDRDPYWHSMPWAATAWLRGAELQKREEGLFEGGFNFFVGDSELSSGGGLSSSSSIFIAAILGLNELYHLNWTQEQLIDAGFAERGACGTWGGNADHAAIVLCRAAQIGRLKLEPVQIDEQIGLPEGLRMVIIDTGIDRTSVAPFVSDKIASEDGEPVTEEGLMKAVSQIKGRGSIGGLLGELYYKSFLREKGVEFDHLRDLVAGGKASNQVTEEEIIGYLRRIPAHIGKDELLAQLDTFAEQFLTPDLEVEQELIARLRTEIGKLTFPKDGLRLRGLICYFLASAARVHKFFEAAKANDIDAILTVVRAYHNGERIVSASHLPPPGAGQLVYMRPYDGTPKFPELWELPGVRERSLEPVDNFIDAVEAQMSVTGYNPGGANTPAIKYTVAGMILAAGLGGQVIFFVPDAQMEKFETVAKRNLSRMIAHHVFKPLLTWSQSIEGQQAERAKRLVDTVIKNPDLASSIKHLIDAQTPVDILTSLVEHHCSVTMKEYAPGECATVIAVPKAMAAAAGDGTVLARAKAAGEAAIVIGNESLNRQIMPQLGQMGFNPVLGFTDIESATAGIQQLKAAGNSIGLVVNNTGKDLTGTIAAGIGEARVVEVPDPSKLEDVIGSA